MPDTLFLHIMRHLNDLYWENKLTPGQIKALAEFALELSNDTKQLPEQKSAAAEKMPAILDETAQILHELFPEMAYSLV
jgi:hypothetical protein